jgi:hypothetical protein
VLVREAIRGLALGGLLQLRPEDLIRDALVIIGVSSPADWRAGAGIGEARLRYIGTQPTIRVSLRPGRPAAAMGAACARRAWGAENVWGGRTARVYLPRVLDS